MSDALIVSQGIDYLAIPGPTVVPDRIQRAMHRTARDIYEGSLIDLTASLIPDLCKVAGTAHHAAIYISNGHGAWEAALANTLSPGDKVLVPANGMFAMGWAEMARGVGAEPEILDFGRTTPMDLDQIAEHLAQDKSHKIKAVLAVHVDTSSGVRNDIAGLRRVLDTANHPALLMVDCIASFGCERFEMDAWGVDVMASASQKGMMCPPGLGFVFFNDKAARHRDQLANVSRYWDWRPRANPERFYQYFGGTAPTHHLYGLREALDMINEETLPHVWARHERLAQAIWAACDAWAQGGALRYNITDPAHRSHAVTALHLPTPDAARLRAWVKTHLGLTLGIGLGMTSPDDPNGDGAFRLGHMGHINGHMVLGMLGGVETGMQALGIAHGKGAIEAAAQMLAAPA